MPHARRAAHPRALRGPSLLQIFQALMLMQVLYPEGAWNLPPDLRLAGRLSWQANTKRVTCVGRGLGGGGGIARAGRGALVRAERVPVA